MRTVTVEQIQKLDRMAIQEYGIPPVVLMENAGRQVAAEVSHLLCRRQGKVVSIFCGVGNNGGDGLVAARHLVNAGKRVHVFILGKVTQLKEDAAVNYRILQRSGFVVREIHRVDGKVKQILRGSDVVVDALFGVGLSRPLQEPFPTLIPVLNNSKKLIVAVDVPSGLNADSGDIDGVCVEAHTTVTFTLPKKGLLKKMGPRVCGRLRIVDIGIPRAVLRKVCHGCR